MHESQVTKHESTRFHERLRLLIIAYIKDGYMVLNTFPKEERYALTAQGKRSITSVFLNYTEGYARKQKKVTRHLYEVAYGSLQESIGVFYLAVQLGFISSEAYTPLFNQKEHIARMLWKTIEGVQTDS